MSYTIWEFARVTFVMFGGVMLGLAALGVLVGLLYLLLGLLGVAVQEARARHRARSAGKAGADE